MAGPLTPIAIGTGLPVVISSSPATMAAMKAMIPYVGAAAAYMTADSTISFGKGLVDALKQRTQMKHWHLPMLEKQLNLYIKKNPAAAEVVLNAIADVGNSSVVSRTKDRILGWLGKDNPYSKEVSEIMNTYITLAEQRQKMIGDGDPNKVWGRDVNDLRLHSAEVKAGVDMVEYLAQVFGSRAMAQKVRTYMFSVEDFHFDEHARWYPNVR